MRLMDEQVAWAWVVYLNLVLGLEEQVARVSGAGFTCLWGRFYMSLVMRGVGAGGKRTKLVLTRS